jgi:hypothetical protein
MSWAANKPAAPSTSLSQKVRALIERELMSAKRGSEASLLHLQQKLY